MSRDTRPLGRWIRTRPDDARIARQWANVRHRLDRRPRTFRLVPRLAAAIAFVLVVLAVSFRKPVPPPPSAFDGAVLETEAGQQETLALPEGSRIALEGATRLRLERVAANDVRLDLERGAVRLQVAHVDGRSFVVAAKDVEVRVVGTRFRVALVREDAVEKVAVSVDEGKVSIARGNVATATVGTGETWTTVVSAETPAPSVVTDAVPSSSSSAPPPVHVAKKVAGPKRKLPEKFHELFREGDYTGAFAEIEEEDFQQLVGSLGAADLLELAVTARLSGHPRRAAAALDRIRTGFRKDPRAGLAALDLGRVRLDELDDAEGALEALDDAVALAVNPGLREDAEARRVQALEKMGARTRCIAAREDYLSRYPDGIHTMTVARRCKSP